MEQLVGAVRRRLQKALEPIDAAVGQRRTPPRQA